MPPNGGPEADVAAFETQQEFLDSLKPVPLDSVDENSRRCAYCWRSYGESNPGYDDAEAPVRFNCNHVFGEQCMRSLFAVRDPIRVDLKPLSFAPGSRGADLGSRLSAYVSSVRPAFDLYVVLTRIFRSIRMARIRARCCMARVMRVTFASYFVKPCQT